MKTILLALACLGLSTVIAVIGLFVVALSAGPSIAAGERAALMGAALDIICWVGSVVTFWFLSGGNQLAARIVGTLAVGVVQAIVLAMVFLFSLILLNR